MKKPRHAGVFFGSSRITENIETHVGAPHGREFFDQIAKQPEKLAPMGRSYGIVQRKPVSLRAITRRWISLVPS